MKMSRISRIILVSAGLGLAIAACAPIKDTRGYVPQKERIAQIKVGSQNKDEVYSILGSPSTKATFDGDVWYYISSKTERLGFFAPKTVERNIVAVGFDDNDVVSKVAHYGLKDGRVVNFVDRTTPTRGKELTFLEQMFGNVGKVPLPSDDRQR